MSDNADKRSWTIKSVDEETRNAANAAASRAHETMAVWIARAVRTQVKADQSQTRELTLIDVPPGDEGQPGQTLPEPDQALQADLEAMNSIIDTIKKWKEVSADELPEDLRLTFHTIMKTSMRKVRTAQMSQGKGRQAH